MNKLEVGAATALVGASVFQIEQMYARHAGSLAEARESPPRDPDTMRRLLDADILTGSLVALVGATLASTTGKQTPLWLAVGAFGVVSLYYHAACASEGV